MVLGIIGENCSGKSTLANAINERINATIYTGNDYLRMAKNEGDAKALFTAMLGNTEDDQNVIYVISEPEQIKLLPEDAIRVLVKTDIDTIKERFRERMHGNLPGPVEMMLERKHGMFDDEDVDFTFDGASGNADALCNDIESRVIYYAK